MCQKIHLEHACWEAVIFSNENDSSEKRMFSEQKGQIYTFTIISYFCNIHISFKIGCPVRQKGMVKCI